MVSGFIVTWFCEYARTLIYALRDPLTGEYRYIGKSSSGLRRPKEHYRLDSKGNHISAKAAWIKKLVVAGLAYEIVILESTTPKLLDERESWWISWYRNGHMYGHLFNISDGGLYEDNRTAIERQKWLFINDPLFRQRTIDNCTRMREKVTPQQRRENARRASESIPAKQRPLNGAMGAPKTREERLRRWEKRKTNGNGVGPRRDITGERFGRLVAIRRLGVRKNQTWWEFKCDCGEVTETTLGRVQYGTTVSCGCMRAEASRKAWLKYSSEERSAMARDRQQAKSPEKRREEGLKGVAARKKRYCDKSEVQICVACNKEFLAPRGRRRFCSSRCQVDTWRRAKQCPPDELKALRSARATQYLMSLTLEQRKERSRHAIEIRESGKHFPRLRINLLKDGV